MFTLINKNVIYLYYAQELLYINLCMDIQTGVSTVRGDMKHIGKYRSLLISWMVHQVKANSLNQVGTANRFSTALGVISAHLCHFLPFWHDAWCSKCTLQGFPLLKHIIWCQENIPWPWKHMFWYYFDSSRWYNNGFMAIYWIRHNGRQS